MKIAPTSVMADDGGVSDVVSFLRHHRCSLRHQAWGASGETLDLGLPDRTMMTPLVPFALLGASFGASVGWRELEKERYSIYRKADCGSRRHGTAEFWRRARADGYMQDDGAIWTHGGVDGRPNKVGASVPTLEMDQWKMVAAASESASDRCVTQS